MQVIGIPLLLEFMEEHPEDEGSIMAWLQILLASDFHKMKEIYLAFPKVETEGDLTAFDMGSSFIVTLIHFQRQRVYIRYLLSEQAYLGGIWTT